MQSILTPYKSCTLYHSKRTFRTYQQQNNSFHSEIQFLNSSIEKMNDNKGKIAIKLERKKSELKNAKKKIEELKMEVVKLRVELKRRGFLKPYKLYYF